MNDRLVPGEFIVYPLYGVGRIESVEIQEILGEEKEYYSILILVNNMKVMIPVDNLEEIGVRKLIVEESLNDVIKLLKAKPDLPDFTWKERYETNLAKIKTGSIYQVSEVVSQLSFRNLIKELSIKEQVMLENSRKILEIELGIVSGMEREEITDIIDDIVEDYRRYL